MGNNPGEGEMEVVVLTQQEFDALLDYSSSIPTGTTIGKRWKRRRDYYDESKGWVLGEYVEHPNPDCVGIRWRDIQVGEPEAEVAEPAGGGEVAHPQFDAFLERVLRKADVEALEGACLEGLVHTPHGYRYRPSKGAEAVLAAGYVSPTEVARREREAADKALREIQQRASDADWRLREMARVQPQREAHLLSKAEGVRLVMGYIGDSIRLAAGEGVRKWRQEHWLEHDEKLKRLVESEGLTPPGEQT